MLWSSERSDKFWRYVPLHKDEADSINVTKRSKDTNNPEILQITVEVLAESVKMMERKNTAFEPDCVLCRQTYTVCRTARPRSTERMARGSCATLTDA